MEPVKQLTYELTDLGWKAVGLLRKDRFQIRAVPPQPQQAVDPLQQAAGTNGVTVRVSADVGVAPEELWTDFLKDIFYDEQGTRKPEGITLANYLLALADFQEKNGHSPTKEEWGKEYARYSEKGEKVSGQMVTEKAEELKFLGLVRELFQARRSAIVTEEGREWLWRISKYADAPSIVSNLMASGKITADDIKGAMGDVDPEAKQKVMNALGLDPLGRKPGTPTHIPL